MGEVMADDLSNMYDLVVGRLLSGTVVPVLGAGANMGYRPPDVGFQWGRYPPSGRELAEELASYVRYPKADVLDLARVSQYVTAKLGGGPLYDKLHTVFDADYPPTLLHHFLAQLARRTREAREAEAVSECMLLVTTNYDDVLERAFDDAKEPYDLVTYINDGRGLFQHIPFGGEPSVIRLPNEYMGLPLERRTIIVKIHGAVDRRNCADSFVITEDDYVDYLTRADIARLFPATLAKKIKKSHLLFLGYSLHDWNFRVMLYRLWKEQKFKNFKSWAIEADPDPVDVATWDERGVNILRVRVENFVAAIEQRLPPVEAA
jgi:SIR2-like domain